MNKKRIETLIKMARRAGRPLDDFLRGLRFGEKEIKEALEFENMKDSADAIFQVEGKDASEEIKFSPQDAFSQKIFSSIDICMKIINKILVRPFRLLKIIFIAFICLVAPGFCKQEIFNRLHETQRALSIANLYREDDPLLLGSSLFASLIISLLSLGFFLFCGFFLGWLNQSSHAYIHPIIDDVKYRHFKYFNICIIISTFLFLVMMFKDYFIIEGFAPDFSIFNTLNLFTDMFLIGIIFICGFIVGEYLLERTYQRIIRNSPQGEVF